MGLNKMYFALAPNKLDISVILETKPKNILLSYALWHKQNGKNKLSNVIEMFWDNNYYPNIILDSGAYTFRNDTPNHSLLSLIKPVVSEIYYNSLDLHNEFTSFEECLAYHINLVRNNELDIYFYDSNFNERLLIDYPHFFKYLDFIDENKKYIDHIIALDSIGNEEISRDNWFITKLFFENAIPTYHYNGDIEFLDFYIKNKAEYIALGGVAIAKKNGVKYKNIISWINMCSLKFPTGKFHIFGCQDDRILSNTTIYSADGTSWIMSAAKKHKKLGVTKFELACENIRKKEIS